MKIFYLILFFLNVSIISAQNNIFDVSNISITKLLLEKEAKTNITDANGTTALHYATLFKQTEIAKLLVEAGANYNLKDGNGKSAYDYALINNNKELLTLFKK